MKRLIVCCDGTWNNPEQEQNGIPAPSNVYKLYNALAMRGDDGVEQLKYYHPGVGGEGGITEKVLGGSLGVGIGRHICSAYHWLARHYQEGDAIFLFGFSRGAFTARSLSGVLFQGLPDLAGVDAADGWKIVHLIYQEAYRKQKGLDSPKIKKEWPFFNQRKPTPIRFVGVWDTVGALGIPDDLELLNLFDNKENWEFHNVKLGKHIATARHAMALDEERSSFCVTRWSNADTHPDAQELWFPGVHADIGGGYLKDDLSNLALKWMLEEAGTAGLGFRAGIAASIKGDANGVLHRSYQGLFEKFRSRPRNIPALVPANAANIHPAVFERQRFSPINYEPYHPTTLLAPGESVTVDVFARERWNRSGVYLEQGAAYRFAATGAWQDARDACDWRGTEDGKFSMGDLARAASSLVGKIEKHEAMDFRITKRVEKLPWFALIGAITNDGGKQGAVNHDGSPVPHQYVLLPEHETKSLKLTKPGYLYCFANDAWALYENNRGSLQLTITRVA